MNPRSDSLGESHTLGFEDSVSSVNEQLLSSPPPTVARWALQFLSNNVYWCLASLTPSGSLLSSSPLSSHLETTNRSEPLSTTLGSLPSFRSTPGSSVPAQKE